MNDRDEGRTPCLYDFPPVGYCGCPECAPTSDTEDVGEDAKSDADYYWNYYSDEDVELFSGIADAADVLAEIDVQAAEYVKIGLARLRRTPETPNETVVNAIRGIQHAAYAHSEGDNVVVGWLEIVDEWLTTQDPNAGGEDD